MLKAWLNAVVRRHGPFADLSIVGSTGDGETPVDLRSRPNASSPIGSPGVGRRHSSDFYRFQFTGRDGQAPVRMTRRMRREAAGALRAWRARP